MANVLQREPITLAVCESIADIGYPVGDNGTDDIDDNPIDIIDRYAIVYSIPGGGTDGSMAYPAEDGTLVYQIDSHGRSRKQCDWYADRIRDRLLNRQITPAGWTVMYVEVQIPGGVEDEGIDSTGERLWVCRERFAVSVTAA